METLKQYLGHFYQQHQELLQKWYPGIGLHRLQSELIFHLNEYGHVGKLIDGPFIPGANLRVSLFFEGLLKGIPLEYLAQEAFFYNFPLRVDRRVLIPRKETELLVEGALASLHSMATGAKSSLNVVDLGTGSGAILLALAINYQGSVPLILTGVDISSLALSLAQQNAARLRYAVSPQCSFKWHCADCVQWDFPSVSRFNLIVSNPPYIKESERDSVHPQVLRYEPSLALFLKDAEYEEWYQRFFGHIKKYLASDGEAWIEGSENHLGPLEIIANKLGLRSQIKRDYTERERFLVLRA